MYNDYSTPQYTVTDIEALNNSIKNILMTPKGSLPGKPRFGSEIFKVVFSQIDPITESQLKTYVMQALTEFEPRIVIGNITIQTIPEYNRVNVFIEYSYRDKGVSINATTNLSVVQ